MTSWMSFYKQTFLKHKCTHPENSNYSLYRDNYGQGLPRTERQLVGDLYQYSSGCYQWETCNKRYNKSWGVTTINHTHIQAKFGDSNPLCPNCGWTWREPTWTRGECPSSTQKSPCPPGDLNLKPPGCEAAPPSRPQITSHQILTTAAISASVSADGSIKPNKAIKQEYDAIVGLTNSSRRVVSATHNEQQATNSCNMWTNTDNQYPLYGARHQEYKQLRPLKGLKLWEVIQDKV